jgi:hypothetical protein
MSSLYVKQVECSILWINHLFQNGRALLKCRIFIPPTTGNPDVEKSRSHAPVATRTCPLWTDISRRCGVFFVPVRCVPVSCFLCCCRVPLQPQFRQFHRESLLIFVCIAKIRQVLTSLVSPFALFRAFCVVVEFHSSHSFANFSVLTPHFRRFRGDSTDAVLLLSSTPATVSPISPRIVTHFRVYCENSTGFDIFSITVRFVSCFLCCCWVPLQPQFRQFFSTHSSFS